MIVRDDIEQGSEEWYRLRKGKPSASNFSRIITATGKLSAQRVDYIDQLIADCFISWDESGWKSMWTERGTELEPEARDKFAEVWNPAGVEVRQVSFCTRDDGICGCSPDGLLWMESAKYVEGTEKYVAGLELKCPMAKTHIKYVREGKLPTEYVQQVHGSMAVTGLQMWHFMSYYPGLQPFWVPVTWDAYTDKVAAALDEFQEEYRAARAVLLPKLQLPDEGETDGIVG